MDNAIIIRNGRLVDSHAQINAERDILLRNGKIAAVGSPGELHIPAGTVEIEAGGMLVLPGLVDPHTHYLEEDVEGYNMLIAAGVTTALDACLSNPHAAEAIARRPVGLNTLFLYCLIPGRNISSISPDADEFRQVMQNGIARGAFGIKIIGGHAPFTPEATARAIAVAHELGFPITIHAGSTEHTGDLNGMLELCELADNHPLHLPHINTYCTGDVMDGDFEGEAAAALKALRERPNIVSESHLNPFSCVGASMDEKDELGSLFLTNEIRRLGYQANYQGLRQAIANGQVIVSGPKNGYFVFLPPEEGLRRYEENHAAVTVGFPFRRVGMEASLASARNKDGRFTITALATDGGVIPCNFSLERGLALVEADILTIDEFVEKTCYAPACMLGLEKSKGHLAPGADADVIIVDPLKRQARTVFAAGVKVFDRGEFTASPNRLHGLRAGSLNGMITESLAPYWVG